MITAESIQQRINDGVHALDAGDYATALNKFEAAAALMVGVPTFKSVETEITWNAEQLSAVIERTRRLLHKQVAGGAKIIQQPIERIRG